MKILVVSDSHGNDGLLMDLYHQYPNMDLYLHAGDSQSSSMAIYPFDSVEGNCDFYNFDLRRKIYTPKGYLLMKHYPSISDKESEDIFLFIHGHTHKYELYSKNGLITLCPGSLSRPRDGTDGSYAIIDINDVESTIVIYALHTKNILTRMKIL